MLLASISLELFAEKGSDTFAKQGNFRRRGNSEHLLLEQPARTLLITAPGQHMYNNKYTLAYVRHDTV